MIKVAEKELNSVNAGARYKLGKSYSGSLGLKTYNQGCKLITDLFAQGSYEEVMSSIPESDTVSRRFIELFAEIRDGQFIGCKDFERGKMINLLGECHKNPRSRR